MSLFSVQAACNWRVNQVRNDREWRGMVNMAKATKTLNILYITLYVADSKTV